MRVIMDKETSIKVPFKLSTATNNPLISKVSFVFVDGEPNQNLQGIKAEDFETLIESGSMMPIKMVEGRVEGHASSKPLGVIEYLQEESGRVLGHGLLWDEERPSDIALVKEWYADAEKQVDISFEVKYSEGEVDTNGIEWLRNPIVRAATIVADPAYQGRTPILAIAECTDLNLPDESFAYISDDPRKRYFPYKDEEGNLSEELLQQSLAEIKETDFSGKDEVLQTLQSAELELKKEFLMTKELEQLKADATTLRERVTTLEEQLATLTKERDDLATWKEDKEREEAEATLLKERLSALTEAGFEYDDDAVAEKRSFWLGLGEDAFKMYVADLKGIKEAQASSDGVPDLSSNASRNKDHKIALLEYMRQEDKEE
jgi:hypothetical protein